MRCPKCDKNVFQKDKFCRYCGERVVPPPPPPAPARGHIMLPIQAGNFGPGEILAPIDDPAGSGWGAHIYTGGNKFPFQIETQPDGSPDWLAKTDWSRWYIRGLAVWNHNSHAIGAIHANDGLELLHKLQAGVEWQSEGIPIIERREEYKDNRPPKRRSRKKENEPVAAPERPKLEKVIVEIERLRLRGSAAKQFFAYLQSNEAQFQHMAQEENERLEEWRRVMGPKILKLLIDIHRQRQIREFDRSKRNAAWGRQEYPLAFICDMSPDRGTIKLDEDELWCRPVIERPNRLKYDRQVFLDLDQAMDWVEHKIPQLRTEDEERARRQAEEDTQERERLAGLKKDLTPYWISPDTLEPSQITYRVITGARRLQSQR